MQTEAKMCSFIDIFETDFGKEDKAIMIKKIVIPKIQRDYAQGRGVDSVKRVRTRFLQALHEAITVKPITLDFIYGDIDNNGNMTPLDGQQRLTTLFLLHWYASKKEKISEEDYECLDKFGYETRYSARSFCEKLVKFEPSFVGKLSAEIENQPWFPLNWKKDPTVSAMLTMIDAIDDCFNNVSNIWERLKSRAITFYVLPITDMGLTDEIYIKMNSRGKPLTLFEHFKAELEREISTLDEKQGTSIKVRMSNSIDKEWTDLLWRYRNSSTGDENDIIIDDEFLNYFNYICDMICYRGGKSPQGDSKDVFDLLQKYFSTQNSSAQQNIETFEKFFDCWCNIEGFDNPTKFLDSFMSETHEKGKIISNSSGSNIFEECIHTYSHSHKFTLARKVLLYAIVMYLQNQEQVSYGDFIRRIRVINNLIQNSEDEVTDRQDRNRIPAILQAVESIIFTGEIKEDIDNNFNVNQREEEKEKREFLDKNPECAEELFALEDHDMLRGQISIVGLENIAYRERFESLFTCDWDKIDCALMTIGNYGQQEKDKTRYQYASNGYRAAWHDLFHKSGNAGFENTKEILIKLLETNTVFSNEILDAMIDKYIVDCESLGLYPFNYYYVKYPSFRPGRYGKFEILDDQTPPYVFSVLYTRSKRSQNAYIPYLKEVDDSSNLSREYLGERLVYAKTHIICKNSAYVIRSNEDDSVIDTLTISQNEEGIDTEDRIVKLKDYLKSMQEHL